MTFIVRYDFRPKSKDKPVILYRYPSETFVAPSKGHLASAMLLYGARPVARARPSTPLMAGDPYRYPFKYEDMLGAHAP